MERLQMLFKKLEKEGESNQLEDLEHELKLEIESAQNFVFNFKNCYKECLEDTGNLLNLQNDLISTISEQMGRIYKLQNKLNYLKHKYEQSLFPRKADNEQHSKKIKREHDIMKNIVNTFMEHYGIKMELKQILSPSNIFVSIKFNFDADGSKNVVFHYIPENRVFNLESMHPAHPRLEEMKEFLKETSDVSGFLYSFRKYKSSYDK